MSSLLDIVKNKNRDMVGITNNLTLEVFNYDFCDKLDKLASTPPFVSDRVNKAINELSLAGNIDYNDHYRIAYDYYNEAIVYLLLQQKVFNIQNIPETKTPTPDFEVVFNFKDWEQKEMTDKAYIEVKSLVFAEGNLNKKIPYLCNQIRTEGFNQKL